MAKGKTRNVFVWIILGLLFVGLMGFGATGLSGTVRTVGTVGEKPITTQAYFNELSRQIQLRGLELQLDRPLSFPEAEAQGVPLRALQAVIAERSIDNEAAKLGLSVGDEIIGEQVLAQPGFRGPSGEFDRETYRELLSRQGLSVREYETSLRDDLTRALLRESVYRGLPMPDVYGRTLAQYTREGRTFTWATLTASDAGIVLTEPSEEALQAHYDANPADFTSPEVRAVTYVWLTPEMIQDDVTVDEAELRAEYDALIAEYVQPERRLVERLVFSNLDAAQAAADAIAAGEAGFAELVADRGLTLEDVDIGDVTETQLGAAGAAVFAVQPGDVAGPFETDLGPALFRMNAILAARETTFEDAMPELREDQAALRARRVIETQIDPINDLVAGGAALEDLAEQTDMQLETLDWSDDVSDDIAAYAAFRDVVATLNVGDFPELLELDDGGLFAVRLDDVRAPAVIPFEDVREDVIAGWEAAETARLVLAEATAKQGQLNETVTDFAALGLEAVQENGIVRTAFINGAPPTFLTTIFDMEIGEVEVIEYDGASIIVRLDAITAPDVEDAAFTAERDALNETAQNGMAQDVFQIYSNSVQMNTDVSINDAAVNAVHTNFR